PRLHVAICCSFFFAPPRVPISTLFPYTTLFRSLSMRSSRPVGTLIAEVLPSTLILASSGFAVALVLATGIAYGTQLVPKRYGQRSEEHTSELQSHLNLVCRLLLEKKKIQ